MGEREIDIDATTGTAKRIESRSELKARLAQVLERGIVADHLHVDLPAGMHGEWVPNTKAEILRMQALGFQIDTTYAKKMALHSDSTDKAIIGDTVFMTCSADTKAVIDEIAREKFDRIHGNPKKNREQAEDREFRDNNRTLGMPAIVESNVAAVDGRDIASAAKGMTEAPFDKTISEPE